MDLPDNRVPAPFRDDIAMEPPRLSTRAVTEAPIRVHVMGDADGTATVSDVGLSPRPAPRAGGSADAEAIAGVAARLDASLARAQGGSVLRRGRGAWTPPRGLLPIPP